MLNGKPAKRVSGISSKNSVSGSLRRGLEKRTNTTVVTKQDSQQLDKSVNSAAVLGNEALEGESGGSAEIGKKKILLLKGKEKEIPNVSGSSVLQQNEVTPSKTSYSSAPLKQNQRREASGRIIRSILNRDSRQSQPSLGSQTELQIQTSNQDREKKPPRISSVQSFQEEDTNGVPEDKVVGNNLHTVHTEKQERRTRNRGRPDRGVWAPLRRSDRSHASDESLSLSASRTSHVLDSAEGTHAEMKHDMLVTRSGESRSIGSGRGSHHSVDNGSFRHGGRRGSAYNVKDTDGSSILDGKPLKRGPSGYGSHEKQVWVQKSSSGT